MKTILYNPIFINPQAYYVFPQLYDIEKGDSFIEPAIYSGYLLIEDLISNGLNMNLKDSVSYQTKNSYNGSVITVGTANDTDTLTLGIIREKDSRLLKGAIYYFALYNKSLTIEEIETEKERLNEEWLKRKN